MKNLVFTGEVLALGIGNVSSKESEEVSQIKVNDYGVTGDRHSILHYKKFKDYRQPHLKGKLPKGTMVRNSSGVTMVSEEELQFSADKLGIPKISPGMVSANILCGALVRLGSDSNETIGLSEIPQAARIVFHREDPEEIVVLRVEKKNSPCIIAGGSIQKHYPEVPGIENKFPLAAINRRGLILDVEKPGVIETGDKFEVIITGELVEGWINFIKNLKKFNIF